MGGVDTSVYFTKLLNHLLLGFLRTAGEQV